MATPAAPARSAAFAGVAAGALGVGASEVVAVWSNPASAPLTAVGSAFIDLVPGWLKDLAVTLFGTADKLVLMAGEAAVVIVLLALLGRAALRTPFLAYLGFVALSGVAAVAALTRAGSGVWDWLPAAVCALVAVGCLHVLLVWLPREEDGDRRRFLMAAGASAGLAAVAVAGARTVVSRARVVQELRARVRVPAPSVPAPPAPAGIDPPVSGLTRYRTSNADFYRIDTALTVPQLDPGDWSLRVHGEVEREVVLSFDELIASGLVGAWVTLTCVSNEVGGSLAGNAEWIGRPIRDVLALAGPKPGADMVLSTSSDGWTASTPLDVLTDPDRTSLFAVAMNGEPLPLEHGFPVRMVVPGLYGYVSATKWVTDLEVTRFADRVAYWTQRGWAPRGPIKTASRIDVPQYGDAVPAGRVVVAGVAWAQHRGIEKVELQVDEQPWQSATLAPTVGPDTWRQWTCVWQATPGSHRLRVRATDGDGQVQTSRTAEPVPDGAAGWHTIQVEAH